MKYIISHKELGVVVGAIPFAQTTFYSKPDPEWEYAMTFKSEEMANQMLEVVVMDPDNRKDCSIMPVDFDGDGQIPVDYLRENGFENMVADTPSMRP